jgi:uncharacterized membrane protein
LEELVAVRLLAFPIALVFGSLPHYSTDRIWISSQQAVLCMALALFGIYALLRSIQPRARWTQAWTALATLAMVLSLLSYEVAVGLIAASLVALGWSRYHQTRNAPKRRFRGLAGLASAAAMLLIVGIVKSQLQTRFVYDHHILRFLGRFGELSWHAAAQAIKFNFWIYALCMPAVVLALHRNAAISGTAFAVSTVITLFVTVYVFWRFKDSTLPGRRLCLTLVSLGFVLFGLGIICSSTKLIPIFPLLDSPIASQLPRRLARRSCLSQSSVWRVRYCALTWPARLSSASRSAQSVV